MSHKCMYCRHFNDTDTELPVCMLLRKLTLPDWCCAEFEEGR